MKSTCLALVLLSISIGPAWAFEAQLTQGHAFVAWDPNMPVGQLPVFETITAVPRLLETLPGQVQISCAVNVRRQGGVRGARGTFAAELVVPDLQTGVGQTSAVASGKFRTKSTGLTQFDYEVPTAIFADGFESGDVSAWVYTRTRFKGKKLAEVALVNCGAAQQQDSP